MLHFLIFEEYYCQSLFIAMTSTVKLLIRVLFANYIYIIII
jgi:hypothetical protein